MSESKPKFSVAWREANDTGGCVATESWREAYDVVQRRSGLASPDLCELVPGRVWYFAPFGKLDRSPLVVVAPLDQEATAQIKQWTQARERMSGPK